MCADHANASPALPVSRPTHIALPLALREAVPSSQLLNGQREILIAHGEQVYRLRHTRNGKLILTK